MSEVQEVLERRRPGRPPRQPERQAERKVVQEPARTGSRLEVEGRDGQMLSRKRTSNSDPYHIPHSIIPQGWDYQWNTYTVAGEQAVDSQILMAENGWRPVPAERHAGMFMPEGHKGAVIRGGMRLEERPASLTEEARREENAKAIGQMRDQNAQLGMGSRLGNGFEQRNYNGRSRAIGQDAVRVGVDHPADAPRPRLDIDPNG